MMQLLKFLLGLLLVQGITAVLVLISANDLQGIAILRIALPLLFISLVVAFWFSSIANYHHKDSVEKVKSSFAKEREKIRVNAEKEKTKVVKEAQQAIAKEAKNTHAKANFKVGVSVAIMGGVGVLFVFAQMVTAGLLTLTTLGGAIGGYYWRGKREEQYRQLTHQNPDLKVIESKSSITFLPFKKKL
jgi:ElaB/YqjD/DUF883 family membrane-anchored ribosome-binding protein